MVSLDAGCSFGDGSVVTCRQVTSDAAREATLEDNRIKVFAACQGVRVETESTIGVLTDGPDVVLSARRTVKRNLHRILIFWAYMAFMKAMI